MTANAPNILIVMADQMAPAFLPIYGHPLVKSAAYRGARARRRRVRQRLLREPLCARRRAPRSCRACCRRARGSTTMRPSSRRHSDLAHYLRARGYRTILSGKMHFCGPDQLHGFEERLTTDIYPADFGWTPDWDRPSERPSWYHNMSSVTRRGLVRAHEPARLRRRGGVHRRARDLRIVARANDKRPFLLVASLTHPHDPFAIPQRYWDLYRDEDIDMPAPAIPRDRARSAFAAPAPCLRDGRANR